MKSNTLVVLVISIFAQTSSYPDAVDDFNRISSSLSQNRRSEIKITEEKRINKVEMKSSEGPEQSAFSSQFLHEGHNLFFQPQILIGPGITAPFLSRKVEDKKERKEQVEVHTNTFESKKNETSNKKETTKRNETSNKEVTTILLDIPEAPILPPLVMPDLPTTVIIKEPVIIPPQRESVPVREIIIENDMVIREPQAFIPLNPPSIPIEVKLPKPLPHVPTCLVDNVRYGISVPCPPTIAVPPSVIDIEKVMVEKSLLVPERTPIMTLRLPKIPLGVVYNKPIKTVMPYPEGFISTTRFLPSVKVSKIPMEKFNGQNLLVSNRPIDVVIENTPGEKIRVIEEAEGFSSFSAYCAHNIALERVIPNIVVGKEMIRLEPLPRILGIPVRPVY